MPWPIDAEAMPAEPPKPELIAPLHDQLDHPGEAAEQHEVDGQDHERAAPAHPAAELLDADRADARPRCRNAVEPRAAASRPRRLGRQPAPVATSARRACRSGVIGSSVIVAAYAASTGSRSGDVTWRKSSSRSLAARAKLTIGRPAATDAREQPRGRGVVAAEPQLDRAVRQDRRAWPRRDRRRTAAGGLEGLALEQQPDPQDGPEAQAPLDVGDAALGQDLAAVDDRDAGAQLLELGQDVAADEDRLAHRAQLAEELAQLDPGARVEARGRLVEEQHLRIVDERVGQAQPLLHPARERLDVLRRACRRGRPARAGRRSSAAGRPAGSP